MFVLIGWGDLLLTNNECAIIAMNNSKRAPNMHANAILKTRIRSCSNKCKLMLSDQVLTFQIP